MLTVQSVSMNSYPQKVSFKQNERRAYEEERAFYEQQKEELEGLLSDQRIPKGMKKFLNVANIVTDGLIAGFTVACATIASATCGKNTYSRLAKNNMVKGAVSSFGPIGEYAMKGLKAVKHFAGDMVRKLFGQEKGQKIVDGAKSAIDKVKNFFVKLNPFKSAEAYDKAAARTATGLGVGAGAASAYAKVVEKAEQGGEE
ncbi:hypothetical protein J6I39_04375 [bacterium]|nr:hypothetical protein [bacterium]